MSAPVGLTGDERARSRYGLVCGFGAYLLWGVLPLYWPLLEPASPLEILAARILWSLVFVAILLTATRNWGGVRAVVADRRSVRLLTAAAVVVTANWGTYIWAVNNGHVIESSLGYFINPLLTILLGVFVLHERLRRTQWVAVGIATLAIVTLSVDYGRLPWIALVLACSFAVYGLCKKQAGVGAVESLAVETGVMVVPAMITLAVLGAQGSLAFGRHGVGNAALLVGAGVITAVPLLLFASAARRLPLSTVGLLQYLAPVLQFIVGFGVDHEDMPAARWIGFGLVWLALALLTADAVRHSRESHSNGAAGAVSPAPARPRKTPSTT